MARPQSTFVLVYLMLLVLLAITIGTAQLQLGLWNPVLNISIAVIKTSLIAWFFMHLRESSGLVRLFAVGVVFWLAALGVLSLTDWLTRS